MDGEVRWRHKWRGEGASGRRSLPPGLCGARPFKMKILRFVAFIP
jgi:hypothetical protein